MFMAAGNFLYFLLFVMHNYDFICVHYSCVVAYFIVGDKSLLTQKAKYVTYSLAYSEGS